MTLVLKEGIKITGKVKIETFRAGMVELATPILDELRELRKLRNYPSSYRYQQLQDALKQIKEAHFIRTAVESPNLVMDSPNYGIDLIIQRLVGINTYSGNILWIEIGTAQRHQT
jgi:hypothetical protein